MTRDDIELATPLCTCRTMERDGQHGVHFSCFRRMRYRARDNMWTCSCGGETSGLLVAARTATFADAA